MQNNPPKTHKNTGETNCASACTYGKRALVPATDKRAAFLRKYMDGTTNDRGQQILNDLAYNREVTDAQWQDIQKHIQRSYLPVDTMPVFVFALIADVAITIGALMKLASASPDAGKYCWAVMTAILAQLVAFVAALAYKHKNMQQLTKKIDALPKKLNTIAIQQTQQVR